MLDDKILVSRLKKHDEKAFEELYFKYVGLIKHVSYQLIKDQDEIEDICQNTFVKFMDNIERYRGGNVKYYLLQIAKNEAKLYLRKKQYENKFVEEAKKHVLEESPYKEDIWQGIYKILSLEELNIFIMHFVYGFNFKDVAKEINKSKTTCYNIYKNALKKVKKYLKGDELDEA